MEGKERKLGVLLSYAQLAFNALINLLYVPLLLHYIGVEEFGLYKLLGSLIAYFGLLDFGLSGSLIRFLVQYREEGDEVKLEKLTSMVEIIYVGLSLVLALLGGIIYFFLPEVFGNSMSDGMMDHARLIFILLLVNMALLFSTKIFDAWNVAHERFVFQKGLSILQLLVQPLIIVLVLQFYPTALSVVVVQTLLNVALSLGKVMYCSRKLGFRFRYHGWDMSIVRSMANLSLSLFVVSIVDQIFWQSNQILLGIKGNMAQVGIYAVASQLYINYMNLSLAISGVLLPKVTTMVARGQDRDEFQGLFLKVGRLQFYLLGLILSAFAVFGRAFFHFWVGDNFQDAYGIALLIMVPFTIDLIQNVVLLYMQAKNVYHVRAAIYVGMGLMNIVLAYFLIDLYGLYGAALATGLTLLVGNLAFLNYYYHRYLELNVWQFWRTMGRLAIPCLVLMALGLWLGRYVSYDQSVFALGLGLVIYSVLYLILQWLVNVNDYEKGLVRRFVERRSAREYGP